MDILRCNKDFLITESSLYFTHKLAHTHTHILLTHILLTHTPSSHTHTHTYPPHTYTHTPSSHIHTLPSSHIHPPYTYPPPTYTHITSSHTHIPSSHTQVLKKLSMQHLLLHMLPVVTSLKIVLEANKSHLQVRWITLNFLINNQTICMIK